LAVLTDFIFAGSVANIPPKLRPVLTQLLIIAPQLPSILRDFIAGIANVFEILSNLGLIVMAALLMMNITSIVLLFTTSVMTVFSIVAPVMVSVVFVIVR
jgi:hypothetical protein